MTIDDVRHYLPFAIIGACWLIGKAISGATKIPNWVIPPTLTVIGLVMGAATAAALGADWRQELDTALVGLISGAGAVGLHQAGRAIARQDTGAPPPPTVDGTPGATPKDSVPPALRPMRRGVVALAFGVALLTGCASTAAVVSVLQIVAVAAPYAVQVVGDVESFLVAYWAAHPNPTSQAQVTAALEKAKMAASGLGSLASSGKDVSAGDYADAMAAFGQAYADLMVLVKALPGVTVQVPGSTALGARPGAMVLVAPEPSVFAAQARDAAKGAR